MLDLTVLAQEIAAIVREQVAAAVAPLAAENVNLLSRLDQLEARQPDDAHVKALIGEALAEQPAPKDGTSVTLDDVAPLITSAVERAVGALPQPQDGKSVTLDDVRPLVAEAVAEIPAPKDGASVTVAEVEPLIDSAVERAIAALPAPKDGVGVAGALIDRKGALLLTLTDGTLTDLGRVEGQNGAPGLGFDDMTVEQVGERSFVMRFSRGEQVKEFAFAMPTLIDRGVFREGQAYHKGDCVSFGGSLWIAQDDTTAKPDGPDTGWRLGVKKGRDGKDAGAR